MQTKTRNCSPSYRLLQYKRYLCLVFKLNYNFGHDVVEKIGIDLVLLQETT